MFQLAPIRLLATSDQTTQLLTTLEAANALCNTISDHAWRCQTFGHYALHQALYHQCRQQTNLSAQIVVRCLARVADAYRLDRQQPQHFAAHSPITYDDRALSWASEPTVSIWAVGGRQRIPYACGTVERDHLHFRLGETDLVYHEGMFYLLVSCTIPNPTSAQISRAVAAAGAAA